MVKKIEKEDATKAVGSLLLCAGQEAGSKPAIHAMHLILKQTMHLKQVKQELYCS